MQTREQQRSLSAFVQTQALIGRDDQIKADFCTMAHKLPILIRNAGLAQALAFVESKKDKDKSKVKDGYELLIRSIEATLQELGVLGKNEGLSAKTRSADVSTYMLLTRETLGCLLWYKRFAESVLNFEAKSANLGGS